MNIPGIHHVTAIASDPQRNLDFYTQTLGLRLVKLTVNFDDPGTYHFYFGDAAGRPGSILTFFPWPGANAGRHGTGQATVVSFAVPSLAGWAARLPDSSLTTRFGRDILRFSDPDGLQLELVATGGEGDTGNQITGFDGVTLALGAPDATARFLTGTFRYALAASDGSTSRYAGSAGNGVELVSPADARRGLMGAGTVHHVAFRAETDEVQLAWRAELSSLGFNVTPVLDRRYFHSIYFREPGGVLFEIATDPPGFATDETPDRLGTHLKLPPWLEPSRGEIEHSLPALKMPRYAR